MSAASATTERPLVLETKLQPPALGAEIVERAHLVSRMVRDEDRRVVVLCGPAGYGKTTLLVQFAAGSNRPVAWVSLDAADDDPTLLLLEIATSIDRISPLDPRVFRTLTAAYPAIERTVLPGLVNALAAAGIALVLDDVHAVAAPEAAAAIAFLGDHVPAGAQLVLASRELPPVALGRLRAAGDLLELGSRELSLDRSEAAELLATVGTPLESDDLDRLVERTEGWPAGIYLAALSLRDRDGRRPIAEEFDGDDRDLVDYLAGEVLANQPADRLAFLMRTSLFDRFSARLCEAALGRRDSEAVIAELERMNLFLVALDRKREWYRYHHLFAQLLTAELARREPRLARTLYRRASIWHEQNGTIEEAVEYALRGRDMRRAAELVGRHTRALMNSGRHATALRWLEAFSDAQIAAYPPLALRAAATAGVLGEKQLARRYLTIAEGASWNGPGPHGETSYESALLGVKAMLGWDGVSMMRSQAQRVCELEPAGNGVHEVALCFLGLSLVLLGRPVEASAPLEDALVLADSWPNPAIVALAFLAQTALDESRQDEAAALLHTALDLIERHRLEGQSTCGPAYAVLAGLHSRLGELDAARDWLAQAVLVLPRSRSFPWMSIYLRVLIGRTAVALDNRELAGSVLEEARAELTRYPDAGVLPRLLAREERVLAAARGGAGNLPEPLTDAELRVLELLPTHLSVEEIGNAIFVSKNTVKTHLKAIYRKLGATSRAEAVARARALALGRGG